MGKETEDGTSRTSERSESERKRHLTNIEKSTQTSPMTCSSQSYPGETHIYSHNISNSFRSNCTSLCDACKIKLSPANTHLDENFHYQSRHENEEINESIPMTESDQRGFLTEFNPPSDAVQLSSNVSGRIALPVIQPQAIYADISTNTSVLWPCTLVSVQDLVPQNNFLHTDGPVILLQNDIVYQLIVEQPPVAISVPYNCCHSNHSHPTMNDASGNESILPNSSKVFTVEKNISDGDVLNLKQSTNNVHAVYVEPYNSPTDSKVLFVYQDSTQPSVGEWDSVIYTDHSYTPIYNFAQETAPGTSLISSVQSASSPTNYISIESSNLMSQVGCHQSPGFVHIDSQEVPGQISSLSPVLQPTVAENSLPVADMLHPELTKPENYLCEYCKKVFMNHDNLVLHKINHCAYRFQQLSTFDAPAATPAVTQYPFNDDNESNRSASDAAQGYHYDTTDQIGSDETGVWFATLSTNYNQTTTTST